jgi:hypothetical protein
LPEEKKADKFAAEILIPSIYNKKILKIKSDQDIINIAQELKISHAIVVGRYHHLTNNFHKFNHLRNRLKFNL